MKQIAFVTMLALSTILGNAQISVDALRSQIHQNNPGERVFVFAFTATGDALLTVPLTFSEDPGLDGRPHLIHLDENSAPTVVSRLPFFGSNRNVWGGSERSDQDYSFTFNPSKYGGGRFLVTAVLAGTELTVTTNLDQWTEFKPQTWGAVAAASIDPTNDVVSIVRAQGGSTTFFRNEEPVANRPNITESFEPLQEGIVPEGAFAPNVLILGSNTYVRDNVSYTAITFVPDSHIAQLPNNFNSVVDIFSKEEETFLLLASTNEDFAIGSTWIVERDSMRFDPRSKVFHEVIHSRDADLFFRMVRMTE